MVNSQLGMVLRHLCDLKAGGTEGLSDTELLRRFCARREEAAFAALMQRHGRMVWGVCRDVLGHEQDAEDAFQATFLALARQAASIRKAEAVASYLHGTARRIALAARRAAATRRAHERRARSVPPEKPLSEEALREALGMLDDEVQALPQRQRAAFVLCCLEGKSRAEAARALGWKEGTVASTLARARQRLHQRLSRRGVTLTSALCAVVLVRQARAVAPAALARSTVRAALSYAAGQDVTATVSGAVVALTEGATTTMMSTKLKTVTVVLLALGLGAVGAGVLAPRGAAKAREARVEARPPDAKKPVEPPAARPAAAEGRGAGSREVSGRVLGPDGKPFAGARLFVVTRGAKKEDLKVKATTGDDGRFRIRVTRAELGRDARLLATARGQGPDWVPCQSGRGWPDKVSLRLVEDDVPVEGRLLDLEGRPLAGIAVRVVSVEKPTGGGDLKLAGGSGRVMPLEKPAGGGALKPWIQYARLMAIGYQETNFESPVTGISPAALGLPAAVKTGRDGTFRLSGFGRERVVGLAIRERDLEYADLTVLTTSSKLGKEPLAAHSSAPRLVYGPGFTHLAGPGRPLVGTVRDRRTGKAVAGVLVRCLGYHEGDPYAVPSRNVTLPWAARATTDDKGQYSIAGVGKHEGYFMAVGSVPYFERRVTVKDAPGLGPLRADFKLEKGVAVRGRLTDKVTGKPVSGRVTYEPLRTNPSLKDPGFNDAVSGRPSRYVDTLKADGSFALAALPGPGLLLVRADAEDQYCRRQEGVDDRLRRDVAAALNNPLSPLVNWHAVVRIDPSEKDAGSGVCEIALEPGEARACTVVGPDGKPLAGVFVDGHRPVGQFMKVPTGRFTITGLSSRTPRPVMVCHPEKRLGKLVWVKADRGRPLTVRLEPPATITGRVVDARGRPVAGLDVSAVHNWKDVMRNKDVGWALCLYPGVAGKTDAEGKFRLGGLIPGIPGLKYTVCHFGKASAAEGFNLATDLSVKSGEVKDLGDLKVKKAPKKDPKMEKGGGAAKGGLPIRP